MIYRSKTLQSDLGFTVIELVAAIVITGIVAALFSQILSSVIEIYADRTVRKNSHIDERRSSAMILRDMREHRSWVGGQNATSITFDRSNMGLSGGGLVYYHDLQVGFNIGNGQVNYQTEAGGNWANLYPLILEGVVAGDTQFSIANIGGIDRLTTEIFLFVHNKPMQVRLAVHPRMQGG
mgnify:CR=1 FL=1